jgi:hypothetical protein
LPFERLSEQLKAAGQQLLDATDALEMQAQGAMWIYNQSLNDWRFYLVTSLVDSIGRRKTYQHLIDAFESLSFPKEMTVADVYLGSPNDELFRLVSSIMNLSAGKGYWEVENCLFNKTLFNGVIYRSVAGPPPTKAEASSIEKRFAKRVKDLSRQRPSRSTARADA